MKKICPICNKEYKFVIADNFLFKTDNIIYFVCAKCEAEQKILKNLQKTIDFFNHFCYYINVK